jgi:2-dehydro-3-deoxyphosphooctonate aldolase (KDO 8-P synthase)
MNTKEVKISESITVGGTNKLLLISGPCQIESLEHCLLIADFLQNAVRSLPINLVFKSSFDKANRTSSKGKRGIGIEAGLEVLAKVREKTGLPVLTDIHSPEQASQAAGVVDVLQTPAFLCRQTDLLNAVGATGKAVNVKKGQFLHPADMRFVAEKIASSGNEKILLCERGTSFGYRDLIVDPRSLHIMKGLGYPVVLDATHSVQSMGSAGAGEEGSSGGQREFIEPLARAGAALGIDGLFIECHDNPEHAPSDGPSMLRLSDVPRVLKSVCAIREAYLASVA